MKTNRLRRWSAGAAIFAAVIGLVACSSSQSDTAPYAQAAMNSYDRSPGAIKQVLDRTEVKCLAEAVFESVGRSTLRSAGITPGSIERSSSPFRPLSGHLDRGQLSDLVTIATDGRCFDAARVLSAEVLASSSAFRGLSNAKLRCFFGLVLADRAVARELALSLLGQGAPDSSALRAALNDRAAVVVKLRRCNVDPSELSG